MALSRKMFIRESIVLAPLPDFRRVGRGLIPLKRFAEFHFFDVIGRRWRTRTDSDPAHPDSEAVIPPQRLVNTAGKICVPPVYSGARLG